MAQHDRVRIVTDGVGGEAAIAAMDDSSRYEIGRKTYEFVRRVMRNPEYRAMVQERVQKNRAAAQAAQQGGI